jgi:glutathione S-transferase
MPTLYFSPTSPYARKARICILESGLETRIDMVPTNPWDSDPHFTALNPLSKVPALVADDGQVLFDSPVVCEYLDSLHEGPKLFPPGGQARWIALRQQALADGMIDASVLRRLESNRPAELQSAEWQERQRTAVARGLDALERDAAELGEGPPTIGSVAVACALGYLDFRFAAETWREGRPQLADWFAAFSRRASYQETAPPSQ